VVGRAVRSRHPGTFNVHPNDLTESARVQSVVSFHLRQLRDPWVISKSQNEVHVQPEQFLLPWVQRQDTLRKLAEFITKGNEVGVQVFDGTWNDTITDYTIVMGANLRGQVIVDEDDWPDRVLATAEVCHAVKRDAESNITRVREVFMTLCLATDHNLFLEESSINGAIEDIPDNIVIMAGVGMGVSVLQLLRKGLVLHHRLDLVLDR